VKTVSLKCSKLATVENSSEMRFVEQGKQLVITKMENQDTFHVKTSVKKLLTVEITSAKRFVTQGHAVNVV